MTETAYFLFPRGRGFWIFRPLKVLGFVFASKELFPAAFVPAMQHNAALLQQDSVVPLSLRRDAQAAGAAIETCRACFGWPDSAEQAPES